MNMKHVFLAGTALVFAGAAAMASTATSSTAAAQSGQRYSGDTVRIENFIGRVEIRTGSSSEVTVAVSNPGDHVADPDVVANGNTVAIDGGESMRRLNCNSRNNRVRIGRSRMNMHPIEEYPLITITAPASLALELSDSAFVGEAGNLGSLDMSISSCGNFEAGDVAGDAQVRIAGSGDVVAGEVGGTLDVRISGSGDVTLDSAGGDTDVSISGSGDVAVGDIAGDVDIGINGSGDVELGDIGGLAVRVSGSGDVRADAMDGAFDARINGSGDIRVSSGRAEPFEATISGSGDIRFGGTAVDVVVNESGSGDVEINEVDGSVNWRRNGRTVLRVGATD